MTAAERELLDAQAGLIAVYELLWNGQPVDKDAHAYVPKEWKQNPPLMRLAPAKERLAKAKEAVQCASRATS